MTSRPPRPRLLSLAAVSVVLSVSVAACTGESGRSSTGSGTTGSTSAPAPTSSAPGPVAVTRAPEGVVVAAGATPTALSIAASAGLFTSARTVVVASASQPAAATLAATAATSLRVPLLLDGAAGESAALTTEVQRLEATTVIAVGAGLDGLGARVPDTEVVTAADQAELSTVIDAQPTFAAPTAQSQTTVLVAPPATKAAVTATLPATVTATTATARAAGASVVTSAADPRRDPAAITALTGKATASVLAVGRQFGSSDLLTGRIAVASTGRQLPGGGQVMFPDRALVALYGHPSGKALGALGEQSPQAAVARVQKLARAYRPYYSQPVVPTFEVIATVASGSAGKDGNYSQEWSVQSLTPMVDAASEAGVYVILDLQPGRADLVEQAEAYRSLLVRPNVGLAIDPEWALTATQKPLKQIGSVSAAQVNEVVDWLADLTRTERLPQKVLVLHQFRPSMIRQASAVDTTRDEVAVLVHADGQGGRAAKENTWRNVVSGAPEGAHLGWKNFYDEDPQMATPAQTVRRSPAPLMVSYQ